MPRTLAMIRSLLGSHWKVIAGLAADLLLVVAAFIFSHYLRFEGGILPTRMQFLMDVLPAVVGIKITVFYVVGLYRGIWRHAGTPEIIKIGKASLLASILCYAALATVYGTAFLSEAVFFIDWMILTLAIAGTRLSFRGMRQYLSAKKEGGSRVLLYGAGFAGLMTLRELRQNSALGLHPIGFLDDDPEKLGMNVQGLSVLGAYHSIPTLCHNFAVEEVIITTHKMPHERKEEVSDLCEEINVGCRIFNLSFSPVNGKTEVSEERLVSMEAA